MTWEAGRKEPSTVPEYLPELQEHIRRDISIQRLAEARGIKLRRSGKALIGLCPFHEDIHTSLNIDPERNVWQCGGGCGQGGDVIQWVMRAEGVSFRHAMELLRRDYLPSASSPTQRPPRRSTVPKLPSLFADSAEDQDLLQIVSNYYHDTLKQTPEAQQYLIKRGLQSAEVVDRFRLGFSNRTLNYHIPDRNRVAGARQRGRLGEMGIFREGTGHEHFVGSLVIPICNLKGEVAQMYGRKINSHLRPGTDYHLYLPGPLGTVWNEAALIASKEIILCEALIDALTFWCAGYRNVTTSYGVNGFENCHREAFQRHGTKRIYIAYDRDEAGDLAAAQHGEELMAMGIDCFRVLFPKGIDANEYVMRVTPAARALGVLLNKSEWLGKGKLRTTSRPEAAAITNPTPATVTEIEEQSPGAIKRQEQPTTLTEKPTVDKATGGDNGNALPTESARQDGVFSFASELPPPIRREPGTFTIPPSAIGTHIIEVPTVTKGNGVIEITLRERLYTIRGLSKNSSHDVLRGTVTVAGANVRGELGEHTDTLDFYSARQRGSFTRQAAHELGTKEDSIRQELGRVRMKLEALRDEQIERALEPEKKEVAISAEEEVAALDLLRDPHLIDRIMADFDRCGVVGEETNKLVGYVAAVSRLLESPLAIIVQSSSAAGKSSLMEAILAFLPEEQRVQYSAMTGQSLFYMGETDLKNKVLAIVEEDGAQRVAYALKLLQSEGVLTIASTGKDAATGRLVAHQYRVEGPVMVFLTTTSIDIDEDLLNRCIILTVDEERQQTRAIHCMQRESQTLQGLLRKRDRQELLKLHRNAQRLLRPLLVVNEFAPELSFPDAMIRSRRDHMKYLTLVSAITLVHQHQRAVKKVMHRGKMVEYIEATVEDVELAKRLINEVLVRSMDELQPQTRRLLVIIDEMVRSACVQQKLERREYRFSRRDVRAYTRCSDSQLKRHMARLEELEYLIVHRGGRGQSFLYELYVSCQDDATKPTIAALTARYDPNQPGPEGQKSAGSSAQVWTVGGGSADPQSPAMKGPGSDCCPNPTNHTAPERNEEDRIVIVSPDPPSLRRAAKPHGGFHSAASGQG